MIEQLAFKKLPLDEKGKIIEAGEFIQSPRNMVIISFPKMGKTETFVNVPNILIGDCQGGTDYFKANNVVNLTTYEGDAAHTKLKTGGFVPTGIYQTVLELRRANKMGEYNKLYTQFTEARGKERTELHKKLIEMIQAMPFPIFVIDPLTALQELLKESALMDYNTQMGKQKTSIKRVDEYGGSQYIRRTVLDTKEFIENNAAPFIIYTGHVKEKKRVLTKSADEISAADMDLEGTLGTIFTQHADAVAIFYRDEKGCFLDFQNKEEAPFDSRPQHLASRIIKIADLHERDTQGNVVKRGSKHWDIVYPELKF